MAIGTTRGKRRLGRFVKPIRQRSGRKPEDVAELAVCSKQTIQRLESGHALPSRSRLSAILGVIGATDTERSEAERLWQVADASTMGIQHADDLTAKYRRFRLDEAEASRERTLDTVIVPGLLQIPEYAAAIAHARQRLERSPGWEQHAGAERSERQALLDCDPDPLELHALVHEGALRTIIGGAEIMTAQLEHMLDMVERPNVTVQVVPFDHGAHGAMTGPWFLMNFPEDDESDAAYTESMTGMENVGDSDDVVRLAEVWQAIADTAPSPTRSADMIVGIRKEVQSR